VTGAAPLQALLDEGVAAGVFPCAAAVVLHRSRRAFEGAAGGATPRTVFDLASLTKVLATTPVFLTLWRDGVLAPETPVGRVLPEAAAGRAGVTVADLLAHRAGLPAFLPLFAPVLRATPRLFEPGCPPFVRAAIRAEVVARALAVPPETPSGTRAVYSDVGFVVLGELLARAAGQALDALFVERVAGPLGLGVRFHRLSTCEARVPPAAAPADAPDGLVIAPTGRTRPREPAPGQEGLWEPFAPQPSPAGEVDDDNAWVMDGVAGHAGLFGTAADVAAFGQVVLDDLAGARRLAPPGHWATALRRDAATPGSTRALGFDTRVPGDPEGEISAGRLVGTVPPGAVGHTGFTGTSLWIDLGRRLVVALCTNRTGGPRGRAEGRIREFRPRFNDAAVAASLATSP
jgi:CubicO group peptidase (beta-lactamase class C family)